MSFFRRVMDKIGLGKPARTATSIELEITTSISSLLDKMDAQALPYLDRIAMLNKHVERLIADFNNVPGIEETERFEAIRCIRIYVSKLNQGYRRCHLLQGRK